MDEHRISRFVRREWPNLIFWSFIFSMWMVMLIEGLILNSSTGPQR